MPLNDYWNTILSGQGRGWGQWRPPGDTTMAPTWAQQSGYGRRDGFNPQNQRFGQGPQSPSFRLQTGSAVTPPPMGGTPPFSGQPLSQSLTPPMGGGMVNPPPPWADGMMSIQPVYPNLSPMEMPPGLVSPGPAPQRPSRTASLGDPGRLSWLNILG